eukprot:SRR837773.3246.p1 GENE.SRR837773.3246~~SRR837773.3246.p1  ORF type:complete len:226 (-),score=43.14 SRR837773.3246:4-657(-)
MDFALVRPVTERLSKLIAALDAQKTAAPEVLLKPSLEKLAAASEELLALAGQPHLPDGAFEQLRSKVAAASQVLGVLEEQLAEEPWHEPPKLRSFRQSGDGFAAAVREIRRTFSTVKQHSVHGPTTMPMMVAPAMAGDTLAEASAEGRTVPMDVDEALAMLLEKKTAGYRGGLIGIVHAAGVQEMIPIPGQSPGKFEFVFAPKSGAAFNLHQHSCMI